MLFNSFDFIFLFLPVTLAAFAVAVRLRSSSIAVLVLLVASYVFYGYGDHFAVLLLAGSTAFNYVVGWAIAGAVRRGEGTLGRLLLGMGVCGDLALLGYFKYAGFLMTNFDQVTGAQWPIPVIVLPIGISFYTFTQIAFLVDTFRGAESTLRVTDYFLFVAYFPHLVAGPIIHHAQTIPQFRRMGRDIWDASDAAGVASQCGRCSHDRSGFCVLCPHHQQVQPVPLLSVLMSAASYIRIWLASAIAILATVAAFNLVIDPYDVSRLLELPRLNAMKPAELGRARLRKPFDLWRRSYDGVALGASQVEHGIDPEDPGLLSRGITLYNAGISEERPFEQALLLRHAAETTHVRFAIVALAFPALCGRRRKARIHARQLDAFARGDRMSQEPRLGHRGAGQHCNDRRKLGWYTDAAAFARWIAKH
jgi:hypothetical protein